MILELLRVMGVKLQLDMHLPTVTQVVAKDVNANSPKLQQARRYVRLAW